jgi:uncharacterized RDD family membrane protein YckC
LDGAEGRLREIPGLPKRERTWKDEVRERVAERKKRHARLRPTSSAPPEDEHRQDLASRASVRPQADKPLAALVEAPQAELGGLTSAEFEEPSGGDETAELEYSLGDFTPGAEPVPAIDLSAPTTPSAPTRQSSSSRSAGFGLHDSPPASAPRTDDLLDDPEDSQDAWEMDLSPPPREFRDVERPAFIGERLAAFSLDGVVLMGLASVVLYFASRAAQAPLSGLTGTWPWLAAYLAFLGIVYAAFFTGVTGQTPGKMWVGVRVVDRSGLAPGAWNAGLRAALGSLGILFACVGLIQMFLDPARRALHDRVFGTRVIHR